MSLRAMVYTFAAAVGVIAVVVALMPLSPLLKTLSPFIVALVVTPLIFLAMRQKTLRQAEDPALVSRVQALLARLGRAELGVRVVTGGGLPSVTLQRGKVLVSPAAGRLLNDDEMAAALLLTLSQRPDAVRKAMWRYYLPWLVALAVSVILSIFVGIWLVFLVFMVGGLWVNIDIRRRTVMQPAVEAQAQAFLDAGGDVRTLLRALLKMQGAVVRAGLGYQPYIRQATGLLSVLAQRGGVHPGELYALAVELEAPEALQAAVARLIW